MTDSVKNTDLRELKPRIVVMGVGGAGGNALNNMVEGGLEGVEFIAANTDAQALLASKAGKVIQIGIQLTEGLGAGSRAEIGAAAAEEAIDDIRQQLDGAHMVFITAGMGGGTGSGAAPVIARVARDLGILTVGVVTKPFQFEGMPRMRTAEKAVKRLRENVDTLIVIPNQNLFRVTNEQTTFSDAFAMADRVLHSGIASITDLMVKEGLINLDFADVKIVMSNMGKSMMGTGIASGENRGREAAEIAISNPLLDDVTLEGAKGVLVSIIGGKDLTLFEVEQAAETIRKVVDPEANIIVGATFDEARKGDVLVAVLATGLGGKSGSDTAEPVPVALAREPVPAKLPVAATAETVFPEAGPVSEIDNHVPDSLAASAPVQGDPVTMKTPDTDSPATDKNWTSGDGVTVKPLKRKKPVESPTVSVAKKTHDQGNSGAEMVPEFVPAPARAAQKKRGNIPGADDFPAIGQKALRAQKGDSPATDNGAKSLFGRLSGLGKMFSPADMDAGRDAPGNGQGNSPARPEITPSDPASRSGYSTLGGVTTSMKVSREEEMDIPSFFKRKSAS